MLATPAQYLLRIDDLCPTIHRARWQQLRLLIAEFGIRPILAVVPDNQDLELEVSPVDPRFWSEMRAMQATGSTIAIHGYRHLCTQCGKSLLGLHQYTEFAGLPMELQQTNIAAGLRILQGHGLDPRLWVAPRHSFDANTLRALRAEGIFHLSDGFACRPFFCDGITWIPQQCWAPVSKRSGLWTICIHPNTASPQQIETLRQFLSQHAAQFVSFDDVAVVPASPLDLKERIYAQIICWRVQRRLRKIRRGRQI